MTTLRQFTCDDLFRFNGINLDPLTEMYGLSFYLQYLARWPEYFMVAESPSGTLMGYIMGKSEGQHENWHGHVTAVTVGPQHRRLGKTRLYLYLQLHVTYSHTHCLLLHRFGQQADAGLGGAV